MNEEIEAECNDRPGIGGEQFTVTLEKDWFIKKRSWWNNETFPLVPQWRIRKATEYETWSFSANWTFFKIWTRDAFDFEIAFTIDNHWGIGFTALLPYLRLVACIPCPEWLGVKIQQNLWRKPKADQL